MVDNENQWENDEYSEENEGNESYDSYEEYPSDDAGYDESGYDGSYDENEQEYDNSDGNYDEYDDNDYAEDDEPQPKKKSPLLLILLLLIFVGVCLFVLKSRMGDNSAPKTVNKQQSQEMQTTTPSSEEMGDFFFNEAGGNQEDMMSVNFDDQGNTNVETEGDNNEVVAQVSEAESEKLTEDDLFASDNSQKEEDAAIMISYAPAVRSNPFKPLVNKTVSEELKPVVRMGGTDFEIIEPPVSSVEDSNITMLLKTKISGIMYDKDNPAAIVNLNGADYFVKVGDKVSGYRIESITKDKVAITYKNNSYVASVGELFSPGAVTNSPSVPNLENKFGGRYKNNK